MMTIRRITVMVTSTMAIANAPTVPPMTALKLLVPVIKRTNHHTLQVSKLVVALHISTVIAMSFHCSSHASILNHSFSGYVQVVLSQIIIV